jgi:hypothetical protein
MVIKCMHIRVQIECRVQQTPDSPACQSAAHQLKLSFFDSSVRCVLFTFPFPSSLAHDRTLYVLYCIDSAARQQSCDRLVTPDAEWDSDHPGLLESFPCPRKSLPTIEQGQPQTSVRAKPNDTTPHLAHRCPRLSLTLLFHPSAVPTCCTRSPRHSLSHPRLLPLIP